LIVEGSGDWEATPNVERPTPNDRRLKSEGRRQAQREVWDHALVFPLMYD